MEDSKHSFVLNFIVGLATLKIQKVCFNSFREIEQQLHNFPDADMVTFL